ncbi:MAG: MBOAT family protein, partial [Bacteroidota bacterium]|nr:MBOAT family protein [Bacteroidota bacterium]
MLFNSYEFIFGFLPLTFVLYFLLSRIRNKTFGKSFLVLASLMFYSWWNVYYLPVILFSLFFNYFFSLLLLKKHSQKFLLKSLLAVGIAVNLTLLGYFKYVNFIIENLNLVFKLDISLFENLELPIGISFYTFQQIAFLVDTYKNKVKERKFINYSMFVTFFPQLIAGPIVHHKEMMPQFADRKNAKVHSRHISAGLYIFFIGLFKKVIIADTFARWANMGFDQSVNPGLLESWITSFSYSFQLYFDFSGYTDMAIGLALMFNIKLPFNFNSPYRATDIQDFWRRWHMTLSRFLKNYLYIPLGGNRKGESRTLVNLLTTFILGGIWHGAGWTFMFWGFLHGMGAVIQCLWGKTNIVIPRPIAWFITFNFVNFAWIFFRAKNWQDAIKVIKGMFTYNGNMGITLENISGSFETYLWVIGAFLFILLFKNTNSLRDNFKPGIRHLILLIIIAITGLLNLYRMN